MSAGAMERRKRSPLGAGRDTGDWSRYSTTDSAATRFYLYPAQ